MGFDVIVRNNDPIICDIEKLNAEVDNVLDGMIGVVYSYDQKQEAKNARAQLNKLVQSINDKRKDVKKEYMKPYQSFESQVKAIISKIEATSNFIDGQIKEIEESEDNAKLEKIKAIWNDYKKISQKDLDFEKYFTPVWLNGSKSLSKIKEEISMIFLKPSKNGTGVADYFIKVSATEEEVKEISAFIKSKNITYSIEKDLDF